MHRRKLMIAFAGEEAAGVQALRLLAGREHEIAAVFTDSGESESSASVASVAGSLGVPVHAASEVRDPTLADRLRESRIELLLSVHSRHLVHADVLAAPKLGCYNLHPGLLPEWAGMNVPSWALYEGAERHGVTLHQMTPEYDAGPIVFTDSFELRAGDTGLSVLMQCVRRGLGLLERLLELVEHGRPVPAHAQNLKQRRWFSAGPPDEGFLDWTRPAHCAVNFVRACDYTPFPSPWRFPRCNTRGLEVLVLRASVEPGRTQVAAGTVAHTDGGDVLVAAADAWVRVERVEVGGLERTPADIFRDGERLTLPNSGSLAQTVIS